MNEQAQDAALPATADMTGRAGSRCLQLGDCRIEVDLDRVVATHGETALEPKAMAVLVHLAEHAGQVVSASELIDAVWHGRPMGDNPVYRCIAQLRRALGDDPRAPRYIATVPTKGYRLVVPVVPVDASSDAGAGRDADSAAAWVRSKLKLYSLTRFGPFDGNGGIEETTVGASLSSA